MKQRVDFEQAGVLYDSGITYNSITYNFYNFDKEIVLFKDDDCLPAPTIGELIEWISKNESDEVVIGKTYWVSSVKNYSEWDAVFFIDGEIQCKTKEPELIDALVELAIKIKEVAK